MRGNKLLAGSVILNGVLAAALFLWPQPKPDAAPPSAVAVEFEASAEPEPVRRNSAPLPATFNAFHWSQLESSDFQLYMANLRGVGCPEETVRDLVIAEINKLYAPKFAALMAQAQHYDYWRPASRKSREGLAKQLDAFRTEKRNLLKALLGVDSDPNEQWANITVDELVEQGRFAFLSAEKQKLLRDILARYDLNTDTDPRRARERRREELAQVLSPEELYQFELRDSNAADSVRGRFGQADLTEAEYKKLFDLRKAYEDEVGAIANNSDPEKMRKRSEARKVLDEAYKTALGDERLKEINRQQDPNWRSLTQVGQQFNLDQQTLNRAYDFQQIASEQMAQLFSDSTIPRDKRREAIDLINEELRRNMAGVLGPEAAKELQKSGPRMSFTSGNDAVVIQTVPFGGPRGTPGTSIMIDRQLTR